MLITAVAIASSKIVGPRLNTTLRSKKSVELAPRSMIRAWPPVCFDWWKFSDSDSEWAKVSTAERASACCETGVKMESRISGAALEMNRSITHQMVMPAKMANTVWPTVRPWPRASIPRPIQTGA